MALRKIAVIGSLNVDFIIRTPRVPEGGETLAVHSFDTGFGGKGANQAVACSRLADKDVSVSMVGNVGDDTFGRDYFEALEKEGIDARNVRSLESQKTGISTILVEDSGENRILFAANANESYSDEPSEDWDLVPEDADVVIFQLEIPMRIVLHNIEKASKAGKHVIVNPAPAEPMPDSIYQYIDTLVVNETEAIIMSGPKSVFPRPVDFLKQGVRDAVIKTLGGNGLEYATTSGASGFLPAEKVRVVDTTAAGDTFVGGYAVQLAKHMGGTFDYEKALKFATLAASKTVGREGAMAAIPELSELGQGWD